MRDVDVVIIGGGAAGLFCAIESGKRGRRTVVLDHADRIGKKIAISGGGRCNFTNLYSGPDNFISRNPHFCKSALARYTPGDFISLVEKYGIAYHEKKLGQLFCDGSSQQIIDMLLSECADAGVEIISGANVRSVTHGSRFQIEVGKQIFAAESLVIATGGLSIPPLGATDFGYRIARQFQLEIEPPRPALVPFTLDAQTLRRLRNLSGVAIDAEVSCRGKTFRENVLITHRGLSGPAILQISSYWFPGDEITINLLPDENTLEILTSEAIREVELANVLSRFMPRRFAHAWCEIHGPSKPIKQYSARELETVAVALSEWKILPSGTEGFKKAEVTAGGISTAELSSKTMESKRVPGLYFIGEIVDVTGHLGGHNFQWAWASGYAAGHSV